MFRSDAFLSNPQRHRDLSVSDHATANNVVVTKSSSAVVTFASTMFPLREGLDFRFRTFNAFVMLPLVIALDVTVEATHQLVPFVGGGLLSLYQSKR